MTSDQTQRQLEALNKAMSLIDRLAGENTILRLGLLRILCQSDVLNPREVAEQTLRDADDTSKIAVVMRTHP